MKTKLYLSLAALFFMVATSCKKQDDTIVSKLPPPKTPTASALKYVTKITFDHGGGYTESTEIKYDDKKRVSEINESGSLFTKYTYVGDDLVSTESKSITSNGTIGMYYEKYYYTNGILQKRNSTFVYPNQPDQVQDYTYTVVNGRVTASKSDVTFYLMSLTYTNDNVATFTSGTQKYTYLYDDKKNPFTNALAKYWTGENVDRISKNNVLKVVYPNGGSTTTVYKYDADGYPTSATNTDGEKITYEYVTL